MAARRAVGAAVRGWRRAASGGAGAGGGVPGGGGAARSRLYEHVREGRSARPQLDVAALSEREVERRRGALRGGDLGGIVRSWARLGEVRASIARLQAEKDQVAQGVRALLAAHDKETAEALPAYTSLRAQGRQIRLELQQLLAEEATLDEQFYIQALQLPNRTHPEAPVGDESQARVVEVVGEKPVFTFKPKGHLELGESLDIIRQRWAPVACLGPSLLLPVRGRGAAAARARALRHDQAALQGFPTHDSPRPAARRRFCCGMQPNATPSPIYTIDPSRFEDLCLAGTSEVGIAGYFMDHAVRLEDLPLRIVCSSTCYRAETDTGREPWGLYRVHQFTKVEMFGVTAAESGAESEALLAEFVALQKEIFSELGLHYRVLDMPTEELGLPAYRKFDIEAWMPGRGKYGEISSASNCTDYQSRRLNIMYSDSARRLRHAHTVNGTACAVSRMLIALLECNQLPDGSVRVPPALQPLIGQTVLTRPPAPLLRYIGPNQPGGGPEGP
ncbi:serine--tRNA ligase, mitochondrial isoform X2 [Falco rusticolus]|uniref:serine--tRNA ligase, mitochondrial isoform X2 n=1 Tax=Falco rusticolus TaxID=120794 RepID=UPI001886545E|nr:serine--tRNA ligase, mitochondrial isoform X2 [Falco rusticolus]